MNSSVLFVIAADGTTPEPFPMATTETFSIGFDWTEALAVGDTVASPVSSLVNITPGPNAGTVITLANAPSVAGNISSQIVVGSQLAPSNQYRLTITCTLAVDKVQTAALQINVPF